MEKVITSNEEVLSILEDRKIRVEPVVRGRGFFKPGHDGEFMFTGCWKYLGLPINLRTNTYVSPFKSNEERKMFEREMGLAEGTLITSNRKSKFWGEYKIMLGKEPLDLDLMEVDHALKYRILMVHPKVAKQNEDAQGNLEFQYRLVDERYQEEQYSKLSLRKSEAYTELNKLSRSKKQMIDTLRLLNINMSEASSEKALKARLAQIIEEPASNRSGGVKTIEDFMNVVNDPQALNKLFVLDAIDFGEIKILSGDYRLAETNQLIGKSLQGAVDWFSDLGNQETKLLIQERLKTK